MVPFTASPTNAMEMNNAMTSSVELGDNGNKTFLKAWRDHSCFIKTVFYKGTDITVYSR